MQASELEGVAAAGAELTTELIGNTKNLAEARSAIPAGYLVERETADPNS
jgi:hypothetical protein